MMSCIWCSTHLMSCASARMVVLQLAFIFRAASRCPVCCNSWMGTTSVCCAATKRLRNASKSRNVVLHGRGVATREYHHGFYRRRVQYVGHQPYRFYRVALRAIGESQSAFRAIHAGVFHTEDGIVERESVERGKPAYETLKSARRIVHCRMHNLLFVCGKNHGNVQCLFRNVNADKMLNRCLFHNECFEYVICAVNPWRTQSSPSY